MQVRVLGPSRVYAGEGGGDPVSLGSRKPRSVLAGLALRLGSEVPADTLVDLVWGEAAPPGAHGTLHSYISGLRRVLEPGLGPRARPTLLLTTDRGYRLELDRSAVDAYRFADEVRDVHRRLAPLASQLRDGARPDWPSREEVAGLVDRLQDALGLWEGEAYADLADHPDVAADRASLDQLRLTAEEDLVLGLLALGEHASVVAATEQAVLRHPLRERTWALHALALTRSGRQAEALEALRHIRGVLAEDLGLDPGRELRDLEHAVLNQDAALQEWLRPSAQPAEGPTPAVAPSAGPAERRTPAQPWGTVGRAAEEAALSAVLERALAGAQAGALLVGEPGIGKTRLVENLAEEARGRGFVVAFGRCSQDDGAPPLWPWVSVVRGLAGAASSRVEALEELLVGGPATDIAESEAQAAFRTWDTLAGEVVATAGERPVLVVLDDLHWADTATLKVLTHLLDTAPNGPRLAVVGTRRPWPEPTGALAEVGEAFARRHATRLDLAGLADDAAAALLAGVAGRRLPPETLEAWQARAGGNPFFLVELARLGAQADAPAASAVPGSVRDVILRRVGALPEPTRLLLLTAAGLGRRFSLDVLAAVVGEDPDAVDERLQPARLAGLVEDVGAGELAFSHALTRDAVTASTTPTRQARLHARIALAFESDPVVASVVRPEQRVAELARHWLAAGPSHAARAWRAAAEAAEQARRAFSHAEAAELARSAIEAHRRDPSGTADELDALLIARARDCQRAADWRGVVDAANQAIALARSAQDPVRMARAGAELSRNSIWTPHEWGEVFEDTIDDLRWALGALPAADSPARCQLMLTLAVELYYDAAAAAERAALADEGVAMARRLGDSALLWWAARAAWIALWAPEHAVQRLGLARESLAAARDAGDEDLEAIALTTVAGSALELADPEGYRTHAARAERIARRRRLAFVLFALGWVEHNLAALRDDPADVERRTAELMLLRRQAALPAGELHEAGLALIGAFWREEVLAHFIEPLLAAADASGGELGLDAAYVALARTGRLEQLRERQRVAPLLLGPGNWASTNTACCLAEVAAALGDEEAAARARGRLAPLAGRMAVAGISSVAGPVDGYLALAEAVLGDRAAAALHADAAERLAARWDMPAYIRWLRGRRDTLAF